MISHPYKTIILDFDGVLVESNEVKDEAFIHAFAAFPGYKQDILDYHRRTTCIRFEKFRYIYEHILKQPYTPQIEQDLAQRFSDFCIDRVIHCPWVTGAQEFLHRYYGQVPLYMVSINPPEDLSKILKGRNIAQYFKHVYTARASKSNELGDVVSQERIRPSEAVFIGDSVGDFTSARQAGVPFIGRRGMSDFNGLDCPVFNDLREITAYLDRGGE